jgi:hypothetical protein
MMLSEYAHTIARLFFPGLAKVAPGNHHPTCAWLLDAAQWARNPERPLAYTASVRGITYYAVITPEGFDLWRDDTQPSRRIAWSDDGGDAETLTGRAAEMLRGDARCRLWMLDGTVKRVAIDFADEDDDTTYTEVEVL